MYRSIDGVKELLTKFTQYYDPEVLKKVGITYENYAHGNFINQYWIFLYALYEFPFINIDNIVIEPIIIKLGSQKYTLATYLVEDGIIKFISYGITPLSMDGEYRKTFTTYYTIQHVEVQPDVRKKIVKILEDNKFEIVNKKHTEDVVKILIILINTYRLNFKSLYNLNMSILYKVFEIGEKFPQEIYSEKYTRIKTEFEYSFSFPSYIGFGQKISTVPVKQLYDLSSFKNKNWREYKINKLCSVLIMNNICSFYAQTIGWFIVKSKNPEMCFNNLINQLKYKYSDITKEIVGDIEYSREKTKKDGIFLNYYLEELNEKMTVPIDYAERNIILSDYLSSIIIVDSGISFSVYYEYIKNMTNSRFNSQIDVDLYKNYNLFKKLVFEYLYQIYALNYHYGVVHNDLHLNNILVSYVVRKNFVDNPENVHGQQLVTFIDILGQVYAYKHNATYGIVIDYGRSLIKKDLLKELCDNRNDYIDMMNAQISDVKKIYNIEFPEFYKAYSKKIESLLVNNYDAIMNNYCAYDMYRMGTLMINDLDQKLQIKNSAHLDLGVIKNEIRPFLEEMVALAKRIMTLDVIEEKFDKNGYLQIIEECFSDFRLENFQRKPDEKLVMSQYFVLDGELKYNMDSYESLPPYLQIREIFLKIKKNNEAYPDDPDQRPYVSVAEMKEYLKDIKEDLKAKFDEVIPTYEERVKEYKALSKEHAAEECTKKGKYEEAELEGLL